MKKQKFDPKRPLSSRHRPPSGGLSFGSAKWRLFALLCGLLLVVKLAETARDPQTWRFLFPNSVPQAPVAKPESEPETKLAFRPSPTHFDPPGTFVAAAEPKIGATFVTQGNDQPIDASAESNATSLESAWKEAWRDILLRLANEDRAILYRTLKAARDGVALEEKYRQPLHEFIALLDRTWTGYQAEATGALNELSDKEKSAWLDVLRRLGVRWTEALAPALKSLSEGEIIAGEQLATLNRLQTLLDGVLLAAIKDDSVWRTGEAEIWFRMVERVRALQPSDTAKAPQVTYVQLFKQSNAYRGETVKVRGNVRQAWHVKARENWCNVEGYYVFVLKPPEVTSPIMIYALEAPPGFPPIGDLDQGKVSKLHEEMEFTGVFFKRWAYTSEDGSRTAPLLLAKVGKWKPTASPFQQKITPGNWRFLGTLAICLCGALGLGLIVIWRMQFRRNSHFAESPDLAGELRALEKMPTAPTLEERLRDLEGRS